MVLWTTTTAQGPRVRNHSKSVGESAPHLGRHSFAEDHEPLDDVSHTWSPLPEGAHGARRQCGQVLQSGWVARRWITGRSARCGARGVRVGEGEKVGEARVEDADFIVHLGAAPWSSRERLRREEAAA
jgi:hypothetical protein